MVNPPVNQKKMIILFSACLVVIGIAAGVKIQEIIRSQRTQPSLAVMTEIPTARAPITKAIAQLSPLSAPAQQNVQLEPQPLPPVRSPDEITARAYLVGNAETGHVYLSFHPTVVMPVASMSKLVTTIAATDSMSPTTTITITPAETDVPPDGSNLLSGETFTLKELLYPLLLNSSNIAAEAIASSSDRQKFLELMKSYAWEIGMPTSYFADPTGLDPRNHASANDMFGLARYLYGYRPDILALTRVVHVDIATTSDHGSHSVDNIHPFVTDPRFIGGKTGRTPEAGETMLTLLLIDNQPIAFVTLGSDYGRRQADTDLLIQKFNGLKP
jgi:D-alanyl-D-alanine endopeptidase (penicillin-binding protein 7)